MVVVVEFACSSGSLGPLITREVSLDSIWSSTLRTPFRPLYSLIASVQRVSLALYPSRFISDVSLRPPPVLPEAPTLARWICLSYRCFLGLLMKDVNRFSRHFGITQLL